MTSKSVQVWYIVIAAIVMANLVGIGYVYRYAKMQNDAQMALINEPSYLHYLDLPFKLVKKVYRRGEIVRYTVHRVNDHDYPESYRVTREFVNLKTQISYLLDSTDVTIRSGESTSDRGGAPILAEMPNGIYILRGDGITQGQINTVRQPWYTEELEVID